MSKVTAFFLLLLFLFIFSTNKALAVSINISNHPSSIGSDPFSLDVAVLGANPGTNYLRIDLFKDGTSNYFGETFNGSGWMSSSNGTDYFPITITDSSATASATIQGRIGSPSAGDYIGPGPYKLKIRRYTSSSSYSFSDLVDVNITLSTPTPTLTPTPESTTTPSPTNTPTPTPTKTPTPVPTKTPTPKPTATQNSNTISSIAANLEISGTPEGIVLGINETSTESPSPTPGGPLIMAERKQPILGYILIGLGILFLFGSVVILLKQRKSGYNETSSDETDNKTERL